MRNLKEYLQINEVSRALAQRAYNKATGAQKNRIKKLYKEIYGGDISKNGISHIKIDANCEYENFDWNVKDILQHTLIDVSKIKSVTLTDNEYGYNRMKTVCKIELISGKTIEEWAVWKATTKYPEDPSDYDFEDGSSDFEDYYFPMDVFCKALEQLA